jgi:hypothetical protein
MSKLNRLYREEDGQALLWGAGVTVLIVACFFGAMDMGQLVLGKIQAQNAADAAAMSAASLKASVHNTRSLAYRATTGQVQLTRLQLIRATGIAITEISTPAGRQKDFADAVGRASFHRNKVERLRNGILQFNQWVTGTGTGEKAGPELARQAAEVGYVGNLGTLWTADPKNLKLLDQGTDAFFENKRTPGGIIGNVTFEGEAMNNTGHAGKSMVRITPSVGAFGGAVLGHDNKAALTADAVAGSIPADKVYGKSKAMSLYGIEWYTVRLMPIGNDPSRPK